MFGRDMGVRQLADGKRGAAVALRVLSLCFAEVRGKASAGACLWGAMLLSSLRRALVLLTTFELALFIFVPHRRTTTSCAPLSPWRDHPTCLSTPPPHFDFNRPFLSCALPLSLLVSATVCAPRRFRLPVPSTALPAVRIPQSSPVEAEAALPTGGSLVLRPRRDLHGDVTAGDAAREEPHANHDRAGVFCGRGRLRLGRVGV